MALKLSCPHCGRVHRLTDPYPQPGTDLHCWCGRVMSISYPPGLVERMKSRGFSFERDAEDQAAATEVLRPPTAPGLPSSSPPPVAGGFDHLTREREEDTDARPTEIFRAPPRRQPAPPTPSEPPPPRAAHYVPTPRAASPGPAPAPRPQTASASHGPAPSANRGPSAAPPPPGGAPPKPPRALSANAPPPKRPLWKRLLRWTAAATVLAGLGGVGVVAGAFWHFSQDLPTLETLQNYRPPTVTEVYDAEGNLLGEIYEKRRYVVEYEQFPEHLKDSFLAAEDANFWSHPGVDFMGIFRAVVWNTLQGRKAQGASTITQQVARNFLLTSEKKISRKIREMILASRIEEAFDKEYILYLYLNQIYLGSGAYGVEAAARIYFDKHVEELTLAESALLAGLPQRPSDYSPHRNWDKAKARQGYVIGQLVDKEFITAAEGDAALAEEIRVVKTENPIRTLAPYFTEHVRRHLVDTYGFDRVYNEGLKATTTCDLDLQQIAQDSVTLRVHDMDRNVGWRGAAETLSDKAAIDAWLKAQEEELRLDDQFRADAARRTPVPSRSQLRVGERYAAVVTAVDKKHAVVGIGDHSAMLPLSWTDWAYEPNPETSWRYRARLKDMTEALKIGDVVEVEVEALDSQEADPLEGYKPAMEGDFAAARLYQRPELQGAYLAYDLDGGAVRAMVGGIDIEESEFNRTTQSLRQVGSTFKPIVYTAAIESEQFTVGSILLDAPLIYNTLNEKLWKPGNYGDDYLGNITMRKALALSRNVCTVRVLDITGLESVFDMARRLGISSHMEMDLSMGLGSSSLSMLELVRAYSAFATYGEMVEPYFIEKVEDRDGNILETHRRPTPKRVLDETVAGVTTWLLREVATGGTAARTNQLGIHAAGKTGTTNDFKDAWFVGFTPDIIGAAWVGYDQPRSMGVSSTGGRVALPIWMDYMEAAYPKEKDRPFPEIPNATWATIDESTGLVADGGRSMPFVKGTVPERGVAAVGQKSADDLLSTDF